MTAGDKHTDADGNVWTRADSPVYTPDGLWYRYEGDRLLTASGQDIGIPRVAGRRNGKVFGQLRPEMVLGGTHDQVTAMILALRICEAHRGVHHFAVIAEGLQVACTQTAVQCLRDQGIEFGLS